MTQLLMDSKVPIMKEKENLFDYLIENWATPLKTVSFWILSISGYSLIRSLEQHTNVFESMNFDISIYIQGVIIILSYIFANSLDNFILKILRNSAPNTPPSTKLEYKTKSPPLELKNERTENNTATNKPSKDAIKDPWAKK